MSEQYTLSQLQSKLRLQPGARSMPMVQRATRGYFRVMTFNPMTRIGLAIDKAGCEYWISSASFHVDDESLVLFHDDLVSAELVKQQDLRDIYVERRAHKGQGE